jgi:hypothetical protein
VRLGRVNIAVATIVDEDVIKALVGVETGTLVGVVDAGARVVIVWIVVGFFCFLFDGVTPPRPLLQLRLRLGYLFRGLSYLRS